VFDPFKDFNRRVRTPGGFHLTNAAAERRWDNAEQRALFKTHAVRTDLPIHQARRARAAPEQAQDQAVFLLATIRSHDQYNTTIYGLNDRYRGVFGERRVLFIHAADIARLGMQDGQWVDLESLADDGVQRIARRFMLVAYDIPQGCLAAYYPETNGLVPLTSFADRARTPTSKSIPVVLAPHAQVMAG
jgi:anaerobic selenocysteine-containing dehydrogenase